MSIFSKIFGDPNERYLKKIQPLVDKINSLEKEFEKLSPQQLREKTREFQEKIKSFGSSQEKIKDFLDKILPEAFAMVREAAKRTLHQRHFDVQLLGGIVLHQGKIAEMKTGEGKTLAATLPAFLNALEGKGVHIVTVNDYLARRDTVWMGQIYHFLGLSVGCLNHEQSFLYDPTYKKPDEEKEKIRDELGGFQVVEDFLRPCSRKEAYLADITYGTNNEFGFDYLRDNMAYSKNEIVQRGFNFAILDEIDSILIDEARTPLIISQPDFESPQLYRKFAKIAPTLKKDVHYTIDEKLKSVSLTEKGIEEVEKMLGIEDLYSQKAIRYLHHLELALRAEVFFKRDKDYIVKNGEVIIVDEFTGRLLPGRRFSEGLHSAIEAKEGVEIKPQSKTLGSITFQNYFRMYKKLAGMTGTALTSAEEFDKVYGLEVIVIPTNKPMIRVDLPDRIYKTEKGKFKAIVEEVKRRHKKGQPVLIGTNSIEKNEYLAKLLQREGIDVKILNAKYHEKEGQIIAQAGRLGAVTCATNMAGRGVDIILGGNPPDKEEAEKVKKLGGLHVIGAQRHEARRIDDQLRGRSGRQGDPGSSQFFISLEDEILRIFGGDKIRKIMEMFHLPEDQPIEGKLVSQAVESAQKRVESYNFEIRKHLLEYDDVVSKHRNKIYFWRRKILESDFEGLKKIVLEILEKEVKSILEQFWNQDKKDLGKSEIIEQMKTIIPLKQNEIEKITQINTFSDLFSYLLNLVKRNFEEKEIKEGKENLKKILRFLCLRTIDLFWTEHLDTMEHLRDSVRLRAYGGQDPLIEYKTEGHRLFKDLENLINAQIARTLFKVTISEQSS